MLWAAHPENHEFATERSQVPGIALFEWHPDQDRRVSKLMLQLKGGQLPETFQIYAERFVSRMRLINLKSSVLVPCPSKAGRIHAQVLAQKFSGLLGIPVLEILENASESSQKARLKHERQKLQFQRTAPIPSKHVIFIDDIVTTGATVEAAAIALRGAPGLQVWCLAHRRQLATNLGLCYK